MGEHSPTPWKTVPTTPTQAMLDAVSKQVDDFSRAHARVFARDIWSEMLSSAPTAPVNAHDEMVEALKTADRLLNQFAGPGWSEWGEAGMIRSALARSTQTQEGE